MAFMISTYNIPKNVWVGILIGTVWQIGIVILWTYTGIYTSDYYSFGPSNNLMLAFVNIPINTWSKYIAILFYIIVNCSLKVVGGDFVYPWINAVVMNPEVPIIQDRFIVFLLTNYYWTINSFNDIFFFALTMSQVDLAIATAVSSSISGMVSSYFVIYDENRINNDSDYGQL